jgi:hypothetical protein
MLLGWVREQTICYGTITPGRVPAARQPPLRARRKARLRAQASDCSCSERRSLITARWDGVFLCTMDSVTGVLERQNLPKLGIGDPLQFFDVTGGRLVYYGINGTAFSIDTDLGGPPHRLGHSLTFVPSTTDGRVWLEGPIRASPDPDRYIPIKEVTVDGKVVVDGRSTRPSCGPGIVAAVRRAVLCQAQPPGMIAADPRTGRRIGRVPGTFPLATGGDLVASCGEPCPRLWVSDPVAGKTVRIDPRPGFRWRPDMRGRSRPTER